MDRFLISFANRKVLDFGQIVKRAVEKEGMLGWQFNTIGVSDAITMGGDGKHYNQFSTLHKG